MKASTVKRLVATTLLMQVLTPSHADEATPSMFSLSGFGTLGATHSGSTTADFVYTAAFVKDGAGYTRRNSFEVDTKLGVQLNAKFSPKFSGVLQVISQQNYDGGFRPHVEWANLTYKIADDVQLRAGRTVWPMLLRSETQNIGYGNPFVRNSSELIANMPNSSSDGVDLTYHYVTGSAAHSTTLLAGKSDKSLVGLSSGQQNYLKVADIRGVSHVTEVGEWKIHAAYMRMKYDALIADTGLVDVRYAASTLGFNYDPGPWFVTADILKASDREFGRATAFTLGGGARFSEFTPYLSFSSLRQDSLGASGAGQEGDKQTNAAVGIRWDFRANFDLKLQYEQIKSGPIAGLFPSSLGNVQPGFFSDPKANVLSVVVNFVF